MSKLCLVSKIYLFFSSNLKLVIHHTYIMFITLIILQNCKPKIRRQLINSVDNMDESLEEINTDNIDETSNSSMLISIEEIPSPKINSPDIECSWIVGQLAWARVGNFPFWPCMITVDPESRIYYKVKGKFFKFMYIFFIKIIFVFRKLSPQSSFKKHWDYQV